MASKRKAAAAGGGGGGGGKRPTPDASPGVLSVSDAAVAAAAASYAGAAPFRHAVLEGVFEDGALRAARSELVANADATYKETDLFKLFQTKDLGVVEAAGGATRFAAVAAVRAALYSEAFRDKVRAVTGCGPLAATPDCAANVYARGGHLLCHDDAIGSRAVSYVLYLTDPDEPWEAEDGGAFEMHPVAEDGEPDPSPTASALPTWNTLMLFGVDAGVSFHTVQEVFADGKPRLSISGWFHHADGTQAGDSASLARLKAQRGVDEAPETFIPFTAPAPAGEDEAPVGPQALEALREWVAPEYLSEAAHAEINARFCEGSSVQLSGFLRPELAAEIARETAAADAVARLGAGGQRPVEHGAGVDASWRVVGPPHKQRFLEYRAGAAPGGAGELMDNVRTGLLQSPAFAELLRRLTGGHRCVAHRTATRRFRPGLDYTVAHFGVLTDEPRLDATLCFVAPGAGGEAHGAEADFSSWEFGEVGAFECYMEAEDEDDEGAGASAEVYKAEEDEKDDGELLSIHAGFNTLSLVHREAGVMRFVKFVSADAPSSRWDVTATYALEPEEEEEEGGED